MTDYVVDPVQKLECIDARKLQPGDRFFAPAMGSVWKGNTALYGVEHDGVIWEVIAVDGDTTTARSKQHGTRTEPVPPGRTVLRLIDGEV